MWRLRRERHFGAAEMMTSQRPDQWVELADAFQSCVSETAGVMEVNDIEVREEGTRLAANVCVSSSNTKSSVQNDALSRDFFSPKAHASETNTSRNHQNSAQLGD